MLNWHQTLFTLLNKQSRQIYEYQKANNASECLSVNRMLNIYLQISSILYFTHVNNWGQCKNGILKQGCFVCSDSICFYLKTQ